MLLTALILAAMAALLLFHAGIRRGEALMDRQKTLVQRGLWSLVIIFVHCPYAYGNRLQDMIGSFAYIGVTFFFMVSSYGLFTSLRKNRTPAITFWKRHLPKLLLTGWTVNLLFAILRLAMLGEIPSLGTILSINGWIRWLLVSYLLFRIADRWIAGRDIRPKVLLYSAAVVLFSLLIYILVHNGSITTTTWTTEFYGCVWGALLAVGHEAFRRTADTRWLPAVTASCLLSLLLGVSYLRLKHVLFFGDYLLKIVLGIAILTFLLTVSTRLHYGNRAAYYLGSISFEIYLIHGQLFHLLEDFAAIHPIPFTSGTFLLTSILLTILLASAVHYVLSRLRRRPSPV